MTDRFYTSPELADTLLSFASRNKPKLVADFACGEGSLLLAAERRWPDAGMLANDISRATISKVRRQRPEWQYSCADFLSPMSIRSSALRYYRGKVDLVVINPPFSRRDRKTYPVELSGTRFSATIATAFLANCIRYLSVEGSLLAVLPDGCLVSTQDNAVWEELRRIFKIEVIRDNSRSAFARVRARTCLVRLTRDVDESPQISNDIVSDAIPVIRGSCQMHTRKRSRSLAAAALVHTTHLKGGAVLDSAERVEGKPIQGPALLFPRVGLVTPDKLCILEGGRRIVLSDCVLAVRCRSVSAARAMRTRILDAWPIFAASFRGTGAPYITVERASNILSSLLTKSMLEQRSSVSTVGVAVD
ncbi:class I SAM-dependent methyltransferase [Burkholderia diffusa]|uniref:methyltransferase n=1 Tax=Burkholderia diffusa TaxID=488732 RepID=UPI0009BE0E55